MRSIAVALAVADAVALGAPLAQAASAPADFAQIARNIIPSGEPGGFPFPAGADTQANDGHR